MGDGKQYKTKQQAAILECIEEQKNSYVTVGQIADYLKEHGFSVGLTTIYRRLDRLVKQGLVNRIQIEGIAGACYQYIDKENADCFYMKCECCGSITNLDCSHLKELYSHVQKVHDFKINPKKTMFYGTCDKCKKLI